MSNYASSRFSDDPNSSWYKVFHMIKPGSKVLDVGCSSGNFGEVLIRDRKCSVHGVEIDEEDYKKASQKLDKVFRVNIESDDLGAIDKDYDYIYLGDVIEHLVLPSEALSRLRPHLAKGGRLLFSVPNMTHVLVRLMLLQGKFEYGKTGLLDRTHLHYYDYDFLRRVLGEGGFEIDVMDPVLKDLPEEVISKELKKVGLKSSEQFIEFTRSTQASVYQFVGSARVSEGRIRNKPLQVSSPVDIFQVYLASTIEYHEKIIASQNEHIAKLDRLIEDNETRYQQELEDLREKLEALCNSKTWKAFESVRKAVGAIRTRKHT